MAALTSVVGMLPALAQLVPRLDKLGDTNSQISYFRSGDIKTGAVASNTFPGGKISFQTYGPHPVRRV